MSSAKVSSAAPATAGSLGLRELIVCSLEPWDEIWRRNQFFVDALLRRESRLRVLFVEPPTDVFFELARRRLPSRPRIRSVRGVPRLRTLRPLKPLPRKLGPLSDRALCASVLRAARREGWKRPLLWINDVTYAPLIETTNWPTVYDVTDDWLLSGASTAETERLRALEALVLAKAQAVVVCSTALAASRGATRQVTLIQNGVDAEHFRRPRPRPADLPSGPTAVYLGTLHDARIDVDLVVELARARPDLAVVLVGPDELSAQPRARLKSEPNVTLLGPRPYAVAPAYLQHAGVIIVPHLVSAFTDSLDPIKARECLAVATPTVATPVAGFRELTGAVDVVERGAFVAAVQSALESPGAHGRSVEPVSWDGRAEQFAAILAGVAAGGRT